LEEVTDIERIRDKIWITAKSRIQAEIRYRKYNLVTHILLCLLSIILIALTVLRGSLPLNVPIEGYTVVLSVFILAFSIVVFGFKFGETATLHRECYLCLQLLHDSREKVEELERRYHEILTAYPNHSNSDYERLVLSRTFPNKTGMSDPNGDQIKWTLLMLLKFCIYEVVFWGTPIGLVYLSVGSMFWFW